MDSSQTHSLLEKASTALVESSGGDEFKYTEFSAPNSLKARAMTEKHLISHEFFTSNRPRRVVTNRDDSISVMINEEDHIRIQVFGKDLESTFETAQNIDRLLDERLSWAFDCELGYLTSCPTNIGTGLRASALLHLPALTELGTMRDIVNSASQFGMTVRGLYGEGTSAQWGYYQISNQVTLGVTEEIIITRLHETVEAVLPFEVSAREELNRKDPIGMADRAWRAYGLLTNARRISSSEAMSGLAVLRMCGPAAGIDFHGSTTDDLLHDIQSAVITLTSGKNMKEQDRDEARANILRTKLVEMKI